MLAKAVLKQGSAEFLSSHIILKLIEVSEEILTHRGINRMPAMNSYQRTVTKYSDIIFT